MERRSGASLPPVLVEEIKAEIKTQVGRALEFEPEVYVDGNVTISGDSEIWLDAKFSLNALIAVRFTICIQRECLGSTYESWTNGEGTEYEYSDWGYSN